MYKALPYLLQVFKQGLDSSFMYESRAGSLGTQHQDLRLLPLANIGHFASGRRGGVTWMILSLKIGMLTSQM